MWLPWTAKAQFLARSWVEEELQEMGEWLLGNWCGLQGTAKESAMRRFGLNEHQAREILVVAKEGVLVTDDLGRSQLFIMFLVTSGPGAGRGEAGAGTLLGCQGGQDLGGRGLEGQS